MQKPCKNIRQEIEGLTHADDEVNQALYEVYTGCVHPSLQLYLFSEFTFQLLLLLQKGGHITQKAVSFFQQNAQQTLERVQIGSTTPENGFIVVTCHFYLSGEAAKAIDLERNFRNRFVPECIPVLIEVGQPSGPTVPDDLPK